MSEPPVIVAAAGGAASKQLPTPRQAVLATLIVLGMALGFWMLWRFRFVALAVFAAAFLHVGMKPVVDMLRRRGMRRELGVILVYSVLLIAVVGFLFILAPMLASQAGKFAAELPDYYRLLRNGLLESNIDLAARVGRLLPPGDDITALRTILTQSLAGGVTTAPSPVSLLGSVGEGLFFAVAILAMAFYWTMDRDLLTYQLVMRLPMAHRESTRELIVELETKLGSFIRGQLILCTVIGLLSLVAFLLIGLPNALALAALAFAFEAIPMVGPALTALVAGVVAASIGPDKLLWTLGVGLAIQMAENNIIVPRVMVKTVGVNPIVTLLAITAFTLLFGIAGALLAIPLAAMIQVFIDRYMFDVDNRMQEAFETNVAVEPGGGAFLATSGRSYVDVMRSEALELAQDVRKQQRTSEADTPPQVAAIEDLIEQTAVEISALLAALAQQAPTTGGAATSDLAPVQRTEAIR